MPRYGAISAQRLNRTAATGREKRANNSPVTMASPTSPETDSVVITMLAAVLAGAIWP